MQKRAGHTTALIDAPADRVFAAIVGERTEPTEWVVTTTVLGRRFESRAHVFELDAAERRFAYRRRLVGENPSFSIWTWHVAPADGGRSHVTLSWELRPVTFVRKRLVSPVRSRLIARTEAPAALAALRRRLRT